MAFTVQDDTGSVASANSYVSVAEFDTYMDDRQMVVSGHTHTDAVKQGALVIGSDYVDVRFRYLGYKKTLGQTTEFPRYNLLDIDGRIASDVPLSVKEACMEYAYHAIHAGTDGLAPPETYDTSGRLVKSEKIKADVVESSITYATLGSSLPRYPIADRKLKRSGFVASGNDVMRA
jgi:hypothetical protein